MSQRYVKVSAEQVATTYGSERDQSRPLKTHQQHYQLFAFQIHTNMQLFTITVWTYITKNTINKQLMSYGHVTCKLRGSMVYWLKKG